jgi:hypothetical protein
LFSWKRMVRAYGQGAEFYVRQALLFSLTKNTENNFSSQTEFKKFGPTPKKWVVRPPTHRQPSTSDSLCRVSVKIWKLSRSWSFIFQGWIIFFALAAQGTTSWGTPVPLFGGSEIHSKGGWAMVHFSHFWKRQITKRPFREIPRSKKSCWFQNSESKPFLFDSIKLPIHYTCYMLYTSVKRKRSDGTIVTNRFNDSSKNEMKFPAQKRNFLIYKLW